MIDWDGLVVALATPFEQSGNVDLAAFRKLVRHVVNGGVDVLIPLGSTGEAATIEEHERDGIIEACLEESSGKPVVVGTGSNNTATCVRHTRRAQELGAAGVLIVTPWYNKPTLTGLVEHFKEAAGAAPGLPIMLYNVPGRTGLNVTPAMMNVLWENPQIVALKESSGNIPQIAEIARTLPPEKLLLSGDDNLAVPSIAVGAEGLVSVMANALPAETKAMVVAARNGNRAEAIRLHQALLVVYEALFAESSPIPLKALLATMDLGTDHLRLPLTAASESTREKLRQALQVLRQPAGAGSGR